jgi:hypothetical protein
MTIMQYARKAILYVLTTVLGTNLAAFALRGEWTSDNSWTLGITVLGAVLVYFKANTPDDPHAKYWLALIVPGLLAIQAAISDSTFTADEVAPILLAFLGALQVRDAANVGDALDRATAGQGGAPVAPPGDVAAAGGQGAGVGPVAGEIADVT